MSNFRLLAGLPPYGAPARPFPPQWGRFGREGVVVEFDAIDGQRWAGNFEPGTTKLTAVLPFPDGHRVLVIARGSLWAVDPDAARAEHLGSSIEAIWPVSDPPGWVLSWQGLAFLRLGADGVVWHTRRLSWDGFDRVHLAGDRLTGEAWDPLHDRFEPFMVDVRTGASEGGSYDRTDSEGWERLASA